MTAGSLPAAADAGRLTDAFRAAGVLGDGCVSEVVVANTRDTILSRIIRLRLSYQGAADAPGSVILKTGLPGRSATWDAGHREVDFYTQVAATMPVRLVPRCFGAAWDPDSKTWHILLEDLTDTHVHVTQWPLPPTLRQCEAVLRTHARWQAAWWDDPRLGGSVGRWLETAVLDRYLSDFGGKFSRFADRVGDGLPRERHALFERFLAEAPRLAARHLTRRNVTVIQGDAHFWNCFLPRDAGSDDARLFDWDSWLIGIGSNDLAYMLAMHWYPDLRREREKTLLDYFHAMLVSHGVCGYDRHALDDDYRLSVLWQILLPVNQAEYGVPPVIWWNNLERIFLAVDDLDCRDLLG